MPADPTLNTLLNEVRASGARLAAHDVEFEMLRNKLGQLNVSTVNDIDQPRDRYSSTGRVRFDTYVIVYRHHDHLRIKHVARQHLHVMSINATPTVATVAVSRIRMVVAQH